MRVAFCGVSGTGKSTLAQRVAQARGWPMNPVGSRSTARAMGFDSPYDVDRAERTTYEAFVREGAEPAVAAREALRVGRSAPDRFQTCRPLFQLQLQADKIAWEEGRGDFVSDRTSLDDAAYLALHDVGAVTEVFLDRAIAHARRSYDVVFVTPMRAFQDLDADPMRVTDPAYHRVHEAILTGLLAELGPRPRQVVLRAPDLETRWRVLEEELMALGLVVAE